MWSKFTEYAKHAIYFAQKPEVDRGGNQVGSEHILLGILAAADAETLAVLRHLLSGILSEEQLRNTSKFALFRIKSKPGTAASLLIERTPDMFDRYSVFAQALP